MQEQLTSILGLPCQLALLYGQIDRSTSSFERRQPRGYCFNLQA